MDHVKKLSDGIGYLIDAYLSRYEDADINDALSALALVLVMRCSEYDVTRTEILRNIGMTYDEFKVGSTH